MSRAKLFKKALQEEVGDEVLVTVEKCTILRGDMMKEQVYGYRFGGSFISPDGDMKYISKTASKDEKERVLTREPGEVDWKYLNSHRISKSEETLIYHAWRDENFRDSLQAREKYMRETKYPNAKGVHVHTYALDKSTKTYLRMNYLKNHLGNLTVLGGI